jgi:methylthioribose-1-phosphate isomerase
MSSAPTLSECTGEVRPVYFDGGKVHLIDQKVLPGRFTTVTASTVSEVFAYIRDMTVRGAPAIGAAGAFGLALCAAASSATSPAALIEELRAAKKYLDSSRPTAVNLEWATGRLFNIAVAYAGRAGMTVPRLAAAVEAEARALAEEDVEVNRALAKHGAALVRPGANILHHCEILAMKKREAVKREQRKCRFAPDAQHNHYSPPPVTASPPNQNIDK